LDLRAECETRRQHDDDFVTIGSTLLIRSYREKSSFRAFESRDVCATDLTFKRLGEVEWNTSPEK